MNTHNFVCQKNKHHLSIMPLWH